VGQFIDDPVVGLSYVCANESQTSTGFTNADGQFNYFIGQTCLFKAGNVKLGPAKAIPLDGKVTPQDVAGVSRAATSTPSAQAIAQFLQSLDDRTLQGKIVISFATNAALSNAPSISIVSSNGALSQNDLQNLVVNIAGKPALISATIAQAALDKQIVQGTVDKAIGTVGINSTPTLNSLSVSSTGSSNAAGFSKQFKAIGHYSDGSQVDITTVVTWLSSDKNILSIGNDGLAIGVKKGSVTVTANYLPSSTTTAISGSTIESVLDPTPVNIVISYLSAGITNIQNKTSTLIQAILNLSDKTVQYVTELVSWSVTSVSGGGGANVVVDSAAKTATLTGASAGVVSTIATYLGLVSNALGMTITPIVDLSSNSSTAPAPPSDYSVSGTVAAGGPYPSGTKIYFYDVAGTAVGNTTTSSDGTYSVNIPRTAIGPFVVKTESETMPSIVSMKHALTADAVNIVNLTSITNLIASRLSKSGDPTNLNSEVATKKVEITQAKITEKKNEILGVIKTVLDAAESSIDPISDKFLANSTGHDLVLDALNISIVPSSATSANVEISVRSAIQDGEVQKSVKFVSGDGATIPTALPVIAKADMPKSGLSVKLADLVTRMNNCLKLDKANRATSTTASSIIGDCKLIFYNNDPTLYKHDGYTVGNNSSSTSTETAFKGIFSNTDSGSTAVKYLNPNYKYVVKTNNVDPTKPINGDVDFLLTWQANDGSTDNIELVAREDATGNFGLIGNLSTYNFQIDPLIESKEYIHDNFKAYSYVNSGYGISLSSVLTDSATSSFVLAKATAPNGDVFYLTRKNSLSYWVISTKDASVLTVPVGWKQTNTGRLVLNGNFIVANPATSPRAVDTNLFFALDQNGNVKNWTDTEISTLPQQGIWRIDFYNSLTADTTQNSANYVYRRTVDRARTMAELGLLTWPTLTAAYRAQIKTQSNTYGAINIATDSKFYASVSGGDAWSVPTNAIPPNSLTIYGSQTINQSIIFNDSASFLSSSRTATISCFLKNIADTHCGLNGTIKANVTFIGLFSLIGYDKNRIRNYYTVEMRKN